MRPFRHEQKYYIRQGDYELVSRKLSLTMDKDENTGKKGKYFIRSLYFDDYLDSAFREKLGGAGGRDKYRIRIYNMKDKQIKLECKHKEGLYVQKQSLSLSRQECDAIVGGDISSLLSRREPFAKEMYAAFRTKHLTPRVIVDYWREPYVFPIEDVRVTFDMDIRTAYRATDLFNRELLTYPVLGEYDMVMEVKFNQYLPGYIRTLIQPIQNAQRSAISKYVLCRQYE
ncbi:polyphosphate polymerase domain-containing protein [Christensenellaceae bacterium OttesenSCG-928-M15]|nr:polyphosphate polymerase domain-containing protein [Christensenellaceae bacterium OttesenSCG-928-M15]